MNISYYEPTYTDKSTLDKVPEEVIKMFGVEPESQIIKMIPDEVASRAEEIKQQRQQAILMREYLEKKGIEKSSFI